MSFPFKYTTASSCTTMSIRIKEYLAGLETKNCCRKYTVEPSSYCPQTPEDPSFQSLSLNFFSTHLLLKDVEYRNTDPIATTSPTTKRSCCSGSDDTIRKDSKREPLWSLSISGSCHFVVPSAERIYK